MSSNKISDIRCLWSSSLDTWLGFQIFNNLSAPPETIQLLLWMLAIELI